MKRRSFLFGLSAVGLAACSPGPAPVSSSSRDPSNPNAPEGLTPAPPASTPPAPQEVAAPSHAAETDAGPAETVYVCPMHPEVTSTKPGSVCPKCNMKLVPKK